MSRWVAALIVTLATVACSDSPAGPGGPELHLSIPNPVVAHHLAGTSAQSCDYALAAEAIGGSPGDMIFFGDAQIVAEGTPFSWAFSTTQVAQWFGSAVLASGSKAIAHLSYTLATPVQASARHYVHYSTLSGVQGITDVLLNCQPAP